MGFEIREIARWISWALAPALGLFLLAAAAAKALDPVAFAAQMEAYEIVSGTVLTRALAWTVIVAESTVGASLLLGVGRRPMLLAATGMIALFSAVSGWAWAQGQEHACGCFGTLLQRTPGETLAEDLGLLMVAGFALCYRPVSDRKHAAARLLAAASVAVLSVSVATLVGRLNPALDVGKSLSELGLEAFLTSDPDTLTMYGFLEPLDTGSDYEALQQLAYSGASVIALSSASNEEIEAFRWKAGPAFEIVPVSRIALRTLSQDHRGAFLIEAGKVRAVWREEIPRSLKMPAAISARVPVPAGGPTLKEEV